MGTIEGQKMSTITKRELIERISEEIGCKKILVKQVIHSFLESITEELCNGNRLEFRDFGVFESRLKASREAQNPKTMSKVTVPSKRTVKFKVGRVLKDRLSAAPNKIDDATGLVVETSANSAKRSTKSSR